MIETRPYDSAEYLDSENLRALYLTEALDTGDPAVIAEAIGTIARARRMHGGPVDGDSPSGSIEPEFSVGPNPDLGAVLDAVRSLGLRLEANVASPETVEP